MKLTGFENWKGQWARMMRAYDKIKDNNLEDKVELRINEKKLDPSTYMEELKREVQNYEDDLLNFFMACFHLKDWLQNDPAEGKKFKKVIENELNKRPALRVVQSICNRTKHFTLNQQARDREGFRDAQISGKRLEIVSVVDAATGKGISYPTKFNYVIEHDEHLEDESGVVTVSTTALKLAKYAINAWREYLESEGLKIDG